MVLLSTSPLYSKTDITFIATQEQTRTLKFYEGLTDTAFDLVHNAYDAADEVPAGFSVLIDANRNANTGLWRARVTVISHQDLSITSAYNSVRTRQYEATRKIFRNQTAAPTQKTFSGDNFGELVYRKNNHGLYDGYETIVSYHNGSSAVTWADTAADHKMKQQDWDGDERELTWQVKFHTNPKDAWDELDNKYKGSYVKRVDPNIWMSFAISAIAYI
jgi:hypothetical protein